MKRTLLKETMKRIGITGLSAAQRRSATGAYSCFKRSPGDAIRNECDLVGFAIAAALHPKYPIGEFQHWACRYADHARYVRNNIEYTEGMRLVGSTFERRVDRLTPAKEWIVD